VHIALQWHKGTVNGIHGEQALHKLFLSRGAFEVVPKNSVKKMTNYTDFDFIATTISGRTSTTSCQAEELAISAFIFHPGKRTAGR
jgi:hypothetical protein